MAYLWIYFSRSYRNAAPAAPTAPKNNVLEGFYIIYIFLSFALLAAGIGYCRLQTSPLFREDMTRAQEAYRAVTAASKPALAL